VKNVGFVGWRGMVGSVLMERLNQESNFKLFTPHFFSTSQVGMTGPKEGGGELLKDALDISELSKMDILVSCQGGDYTKQIYSNLRKNWKGIWIDAASTLRMEESSTLIIDPVNGESINQAIKKGKKDFIGANCTVSLMLMATKNLFENDLISWVSSMTYQAASGAGANNMKELISQMGFLWNQTENHLKDKTKSILEIDKVISQSLKSDAFPDDNFKAPLAGSLIPWIDSKMENGQTREEWKAQVEANKILNRSKDIIPIDGTCVRIGAMRSHSQALTIKLKKDVPIDEINSMLKENHQWMSFAENNQEDSRDILAPANISGTLNIGVGRVRKMTLGPDYLNLFTVGDQLLWGAAEPLRRVLIQLV